MEIISYNNVNRNLKNKIIIVAANMMHTKYLGLLLNILHALAHLIFIPIFLSHFGVE